MESENQDHINVLNKYRLINEVYRFVRFCTFHNREISKENLHIGLSLIKKKVRFLCNMNCDLLTMIHITIKKSFEKNWDVKKHNLIDATTCIIIFFIFQTVLFIHLLP